MNSNKVLIGIVGYESEDCIENCLKSVLDQSHKNISVVFFDNYGRDNSAEIISRKFPSVQYILSEENLGYGRSHNVLINRFEYDYYMPLNPDVVLDENYVSEAIKEFENEPALGAVNGLVYYLDNGIKTDMIYSCGHIMHRDRRVDNLYYTRLVSEVNLDRRFVFGPNGACPLIKSEAIEAIKVEGHFFDPVFFMYGDDIDIGWRMSKSGWKSVFSPTCKAWHSIGGSKPFRNRKIRIEYIANRYIVLLKNDNFWLFLRDLPVILFVEIMFFTIHFVKRPSFIGDFSAAIFKFLKFIPYSLKYRYSWGKKTSIAEDDKLLEKEYFSRLKNLIFRQVIQKKKLKTIY